MKRFTFFLSTFTAIFFLLTNSSFAQHWTWQYPNLQGNSLSDIRFVNSNYGWTAGSHGTIMHTIDGGAHWTIQFSNTTASLYSVTFCDENNGWVAGDTVLHTTNGGATWVGGYSQLPSGPYTKIQCTDANHCWIVSASGIVYYTTDGGNVWNTSSIFNVETYDVIQLYFINSENGWLASSSYIYHTTNGGTSWTMITHGVLSDVAIYFHDASHGAYIDNFARIRTTTNGGALWVTRYQANQNIVWLTSMSFPDANHGYVMESSDSVLITHDGGMTWTARLISPQVTLWGVSFSDSSNGWACGSGGVIMHTTDSGVTWNQQTELPISEVNGITFSGSTNGWAVGYGGTILHTTNGGAIWSQQAGGTAQRLNSVCFIGNEDGWTVGDTGVIIHTTNGGTNWSVIDPITTQKLNRIVFTSASNGYIVGNNGNLYQTTDGGINWENQYLGYSQPLIDIFWLDLTNGFIVGTGRFYSTTDGGATWQSLDGQYGLHGMSVGFTDVNHGWVLSIYRSYYTTTDAGSSWTEHIVDSTGNLALTRMRFDGNEGWIIGNSNSSSVIFHSSDSGANWSREIVTSNLLYDIASTSSNVWLTGNSSILHREESTYGTLSGTVHHFTSNTPFRNVSVTVNGQTTLSDSLGNFTFTNLLTGNFIVSARATGSPPCDTTVAIVANQTTTANFRMISPNFHVSLTRQDSILHPSDSICYTRTNADPVVAQNIYLGNNGDGAMTWNTHLEFDYANPYQHRGRRDIHASPIIEETDDLYDSAYSFDATQAVGGDRGLNGIEFDGRDFWITGANNFNGNARLYKVSKSGQLERTFYCYDSLSTYGWRDLAWDGHYLYSSCTHYIDKIDTSDGHVVARFATALDPVYTMTIDTANGMIYYCSANSNIFKMRLSDGVVVDNFASPGGVYGMGWYPYDTDSKPLYLFCRDLLQNTSGARLYKVDPVTHNYQSLVNIGQGNERAEGMTITSKWNPIAWTTISLLNVPGGNSRVRMNLLSLNTNWITLQPSSGAIAAYSRDSISVQMASTALIPGTYRLLLRITSSTVTGDAVVPIVMTIVDQTGVSEASGTIPTKFALEYNYPNPFNPVTTIRFTLDQNQPVKLILYNVNGREVANLYTGTLGEGEHTVRFDGRGFASGVYFVRLEGKYASETRKITLLK